MARYLIRLTVPHPPQRAWEALWDLRRHEEVIPFTHVRGDAVAAPGPVAAALGAGSRFVARTGLGPVGFDDVMEITEWCPPGGPGGEGRARVRKHGRVIRGDIQAWVGPVPGGAEVLWRQDVRLLGVPAVADPLVGAACRLAYGHALRRLLTDPTAYGVRQAGARSRPARPLERLWTPRRRASDASDPLRRLAQVSNCPDDGRRRTPPLPGTAGASGPPRRRREVTVMDIAWGPQLECGRRDIDAQHKRLVELLRRADLAAHGHVPYDARWRTLCDLRAYTAVHFAHEERLLDRHGLAATAPEHHRRHLAEHRELTAHVDRLAQAFELGEPVEGELLALLTAWLVEHIQGTDREMADLLSEAEA